MTSAPTFDSTLPPSASPQVEFMLATLDQLTEGRAVVHLITGGSDVEQARQGDYLPKDRRYARTSEYVDVLRKSWTEAAPFSYEGEFYKFEDFGPGFAPTDERAWEKAFDYAARAGQSAEAFRALFLGKSKVIAAESAGAQRQQEYATAHESYDRASWSGIIRATGGAGAASTALVGSYETVAAAILDQVDAGASIVSIRGFDTLNDVVDCAGTFSRWYARRSLTARPPGSAATSSATPPASAAPTSSRPTTPPPAPRANAAETAPAAR